MHSSLGNVSGLISSSFRLCGCFFILNLFLIFVWAESPQFPWKYYIFPLATHTYSKVGVHLLKSGIENGGNLSFDENVIENQIYYCEKYIMKLLNDQTSFPNKNNISRLTMFFEAILNVNGEYLKTFGGGTTYEYKKKVEHIKNDKINRISDSWIIIENFVNPISAKSFGLSELLDSMWEFYREHDFIDIKGGSYEISQEMKCNDGLSVQQRLFDLTNCVLMSVLNGYFILSKLNAGDARRKTEYFETMRNTSLSIARKSTNVIKKASQTIRRCDPEKYEQGVNFVPLSLIRATVVAKDYFQEPLICQSQRSCADFKDEELHIRLNKPRYQCSRHVHDCWDTEIKEICFPEHPNESSRKYQAFKDNNGNKIGPWNNNCRGSNVASWTDVSRMMYTEMIRGITFSHMSFVSCDICVCDCFDVNYPGSIRKFSLQPVLAKHEQGVITGIKFHVHQDTIVLKIRVGILVNGVVDVEQQSWDSKYVSDTENDKKNGTRQQISYGTVTLQYDWRSVFLDDIQGPPGTIIQGVKFVRGHDGIAISILATSVNEEGKLLPKTAKWYPDQSDNNLRTDKRRKVQVPHQPDIPTQKEKPNTITSVPNSYVKFQTTDWMSDASQTTIPFFDIQEVITTPPAPLGGVGLYYKTQTNSGGFIGLQLLSFDASYLLSEDSIKRDVDKLTGI